MACLAALPAVPPAALPAVPLAARSAVPAPSAVLLGASPEALSLVH